MRAILKSTALAAGLGLVVWLTRNRLLAPAPVDIGPAPHFRTGSRPAAPSPDHGRANGDPSDTDTHTGSGEGRDDVAGPDDLTEIVGIGPVYRDRLHRAGITGFADLAAADAAGIAGRVGTGEAAVADWVEQARDRTG